MKSSRLTKYLSQKGKTSPKPITKKEEVKNSPDNKIDEDFPGYPHGQSKESVIKPASRTQKKTAATDVKDGEKKTAAEKKQAAPDDEQSSEGSGGAFDAAEEVRE